jgi:hypothetical protein
VVVDESSLLVVEVSVDSVVDGVLVGVVLPVAVVLESADPADESLCAAAVVPPVVPSVDPPSTSAS